MCLYTKLRSHLRDHTRYIKWPCRESWIKFLSSTLKLKGVDWISKHAVSRPEKKTAMSVSVFYNFICACLRRCRSFNKICVVVISSVSNVAVFHAVTLSGDRHEGSIPANFFWWVKCVRFLSCHDLDFPSDLRRILTIFRRLLNIAEMSEDVPTENEHSRNFSETHQFLWYGTVRTQSHH